jgi:ATPase subunit of ABC transporter with duplicated ATPase domains
VLSGVVRDLSYTGADIKTRTFNQNKKMSNTTTSLLYEQVMESIRESQKVTQTVIQDFVKETNLAMQKLAERQQKFVEEQQKAAEERQQKFVEEQQKVAEEAAKRAAEEDQKRHEEEQKRHEEMEKSTKELRRQMGELGNRFGEVTEHMVFPAIVARFNELGYRFNKEFEGNCKVIDNNGKIIAEIDAYLENHTTIAVVEIKSKPKEGDIGDHIQRIEKLKQNRQELKEPTKIIIGAIAGAVFTEKVKAAAINAGFYVLVQSGDTMKFDIPQNFKPREF